MKTPIHLPLGLFLLFVVASILSAAESRDLRWLEANGTSPVMGTTLGVPWPKGSMQADASLVLRSADGAIIPAQSWPLAYWPDGSLKWSGIAVGPIVSPSDSFTLASDPHPPEGQPDSLVRSEEGAVVVDTGAIQARIEASGNTVIQSIFQNGRETASKVRLVALNQLHSGEPITDSVKVESYSSRIDRVEVEQNGPVRAVVKVEGIHSGNNREILPFTLRLYFYANSANIRMVHTFVYDLDERADFLKGLGVRFDVPMTDPLYDRHIRFSSAEGGLWREAVRNITGQRRDPGAGVRAAQAEGKALPEPATWDRRVTDRLNLIPAWGDFRLAQLSADGYEISKRTAAGYGWIRSTAGMRASGMGYVGGASGGVAFGMRDFWQSYPSQIDIRNAASSLAETTLWLWAPDAQPMDLRYYHDGMGMKTLDEEREGGMAITYEDYKEGMGKPYGVARTSELNLWITDATPSGDALLAYARNAMTPPMLAVSPEQLLDAGVFGGIWSLPDRSTPTRSRIEDMLDHAFAQHAEQREAHRWYGFWDYGDVMHSFDTDRNVWRYDVGGFAWANSELSPDIWLWTMFLRTGRADVFRFAEAMTRHTGEVDVYHIGPQALLGSRHNVQHWGDGMKQVRISTPVYRRYFYYLTADERVGDLMRAQLEAYKTYVKYDWFSKTMREPDGELDPHAMPVGVGLEMGTIGMGWLIEWERTLNPEYRSRLENYMSTVGELPYGFLSTQTVIDMDTGRVSSLSPDKPVGNMSHLNMVFGYPELAFELLQLFDIRSYRDAWLEYCTWYNADQESRKKAIGVDVPTGNLNTYYSRLTAFAAYLTHDEALARRAWNEILGSGDVPTPPFATAPKKFEAGPDSLHAFEVGRFMSTNWISEWNNAMMQNLRFVGEYLEVDDSRTVTAE